MSEEITPPKQPACTNDGLSVIMTLSTSDLEEAHRHAYALTQTLRRLLGYPKLVAIKPKKPKHPR
jgi:hypothetical protein